MGNIPDNPADKYDRLVKNNKQLRRKLKKLDDAYIDATNNKQLFKEIRDILVDIRHFLKVSDGIQSDDDVDAIN